MNPNFCPTCHTAIPDHAPGGFCPACLLRDADDSPTQVRLAPSVAEISEAFPQWEILALIGEGGMGFVYQIRQPALDRIVALKILSPELSRDPAFAERFAREARVLGKLSHPNIVTVYESGESGGFFYLVMEYVDGVNLRQAMRAGRFTPQQALAVVPGICDALQAAHAQGVWHRDIKPENILLDARGNVKIVDFGIARLVGDPRRDFTLTRTGAALGSAAYMAPEQHEKPHDVDHRADIYSLGVVIYEMLTGELPLGRFPAPSAKAAVDARIDEIVFRTLEKEREMRQQSATEVKTDMQNAAVAPKLPGSRVIDFSSWKLVLAAVVFSYIGTSWRTFTDDDEVRTTFVGFAGHWLVGVSLNGPALTILTKSYSLIAMFLAGACWLRWLWLKRLRNQRLASFLDVSGANMFIKINCIGVSSVAFFMWAWMAMTGMYLNFGGMFTHSNDLYAPVWEFLMAGIACGIVWTVYQVLHFSNNSAYAHKLSHRPIRFEKNPNSTLISPLESSPSFFLCAGLWIGGLAAMIIAERSSSVVSELGVVAAILGFMGCIVILWKMRNGRYSKQYRKPLVVILSAPILLMVAIFFMKLALFYSLDPVSSSSSETINNNISPAFRVWLQGEWELDKEASKRGESSPEKSKNLAKALAYIQASESGQMLLTITPEQIAWTTKSEKAWKPTQELTMENGRAFLLLKLPDGQSSTMVRFDRHDENTLLITPLEGDRTSNGPVPRYTLVFKRKSFGNAEKNQESIWESKSVFGPVVERSLYFSDNMRTYLDFQSGESSRAQWALSAIPTDEAQKTWLKQTGVDAYAIEPIKNKPDQSGVVVHEHPRLSSWSGGCVFALVPHSQSFDSPLAEDMEACLKDAADTQALMGGTYWFKTSDGAKGIVHVYGINQSSQELQLRYRLFQQQP